MILPRPTIRYFTLLCLGASSLVTAGIELGGEADRVHLSNQILIGTGPVRFEANGCFLIPTADGEKSISAREVCHLGNYSIPQRGSVLRLTDGSELVGTLLDFGHEGVRWDSTAFGIMDFPWVYVRALTLQPTINPQAWFERQKVKNSAALSEDFVLQLDGNWARGLSRISRSQNEEFSGFDNGLAIEWKGQEDWKSLNLSDLVELVFSEAVAPTVHAEEAIEVGFRDGTRLRLSSWSIGPDKELEFQTVLPIRFPEIAATRSSFTRLEYARASPRSCRFLSDESPARFRNLPQWTVHRDLKLNASLDGKLMLMRGGRNVLRGISMPSRSQATWHLDPKKDQRFLAEVAVPLSQTSDAPFGSVVAKVLVSRSRSLVTVWESPLIRAGDAPLVVDVDVRGAELIVLLVDPAEFGDTNDEVYWIEPRVFSP